MAKTDNELSSHLRWNCLHFISRNFRSVQQYCSRTVTKIFHRPVLTRFHFFLSGFEFAVCSKDAVFLAFLQPWLRNHCYTAVPMPKWMLNSSIFLAKEHMLTLSKLGTASLCGAWSVCPLQPYGLGLPSAWPHSRFLNAQIIHLGKDLMDIQKTECSGYILEDRIWERMYINRLAGELMGQMLHLLALPSLIFGGSSNNMQFSSKFCSKIFY